MTEATTTTAVGIENTKKVLHLAIAIVNTIDKAKADGKIDMADMGLLFTLIPAVQPGISGVSAFPKEMVDLSVAEVTELSAFIVTELSIDDAKAKLVIEKALKLVASAIDLIGAIKS